MKNENDEIAETKREEQKSAGQVLKSLWRHKFLILFIFMLAVAIMLGFLWKSARKKQDDLMAQMTQQQEQLERQQILLDALEQKASEEKDSHETIPVITSETIKSQLVGMKDLVTAKYFYTNADREESEKTWIFGWTQPFSSKSILITYDGYIKAGIDFNAIQTSVDEDTKTITVTIPKSTVTDNNIPQDTITVLEVKNGLFNKVTFDNYNEFVSEQKIIMEQKAINQGLLTQANEQAEAIVKSLLSGLPGIEEYLVQIQWIEA